MSKPNEDIKISVIIPFYNRLSLLFQSIESVLEQTYQNFEIILIDDGSTDDVRDLLDFIKKDSRIIYQRQEHGGVSLARNLGITLATESYIAFLDSDDLFAPEKLEKQLSFMLKNDYDISHTSYERITMEGNVIERVNSGDEFRGNVFPAILYYCPIATPTVMIRKKILSEIKKVFNTEFSLGEDVCFYIDLAYQYEIGGLAQSLTKVRVGDSSTAFNQQKQKEGFSNIISYILRNKEYCKYESEVANLVEQFSKKFSLVSQPVGGGNKTISEKQRLQQQVEKLSQFKKIGFCPLVSIVIPVYNGANFLRQAIDSALQQTYPNIEIIVINDGSTDNGETEKIALSYGERIRYFHQENGGVATALNFGIEHMCGEYFSWLSHDDMYTSEKIEQEVLEAFENGNKDAIIYCGYSTIDEKGLITKNYRLPDYITNNIKGLLTLDITYTLNGCALLIPKSLFERYGKFNSKYKYTQDYDLWFRFSDVTQFIYVDKCMMLSRQHPGQESRAKNDVVTVESDHFHYRTISALSLADIESYIGNKTNTLFDLFNTYRANRYYLTSIAIMQLIADISVKSKGNVKMVELVNREFTMLSSDKSGLNEKDFYSFDSKTHKKPIIMIYSNVWTLGGLERVMKTVMEYLVTKYRIILVSYYVPNEKGFDIPDEVMHIKLNQTEEDKIAFRLAALAKLLKVDLLIGNPNIIIDLLPIYALLKDLGIKSIAANHYYYFLPYTIPWIYPVALKRIEAYQSADAVTWCTSFSAGLYAQLGQNAVLMPNPNPYNEIHSISNPTEKIVLCVGRFYDSIKRVDRMLITFKKVYQKHPDAKLLLVGGHDLDMLVPGKQNQTIRQLLNTLGLPNEAVVFVGEQTNVSQFYQKASLLLMTSDCEGFPMVLTEAGSFGLPVVMFEIPGMEDVITDGVNGFVVPQDNYDQLADRISELLSDDELRKKVGQEAQRLSARFSKQKICERWGDLVQTVLNSESTDDLNQKLKNRFMISNNTSAQIYGQAVKEYEGLLQKFLGQITAATTVATATPALPNVAQTANVVYAVPCPECINMQNSLSWRIKKPLRLVKKFSVYVKAFGWRITLRKAYRKVVKTLIRN
jgi:glycosyltransferase involved in cell wall biosynthesis